MGEESPYVSSGEVGRLCGVHAVTVRKWVRQGELKPSHRTPGGELRFRHVEVIRWLERRKRETERELAERQKALDAVKRLQRIEEAGRGE